MFACSVALWLLSAAPVRATWSIVIANSETREIGVGTVTCLGNFDLLKLVPVVVVEKGAAAVQAAGDFDGLRRPLIFDRLMEGEAPFDILLELRLITGHNSRQYGIVDVLGRAVSSTGSATFQWAGGQFGSLGPFTFAVQGNILVGSCVRDAIFEAIADQTLDFPDKLMAGMEAARRAGGDGRCSCNLNSPQSCGCPPRSFVKSGHIGCMVVARVGDTDDTVCSKNGCADGDYFMTLNVKFQGRDDPDPVFQLRDQFTAWRNAHRDVPDAVHSTAKLSFDRLPSDGVSQSTLAIRLRDFRNRLVAVAPGSLTVSHAPNSAGISTLGPLVDNGNGVFFVTITAGVGSGAAEAVSGTDLFRITIADGSRPVILMPEPELTFCDPGPNCLPPPVCGDNVVNQTSEVCDGTDDAACPGACQPNCTCPPAEICGDNVVNQTSEVCDGSDDAACPGACRSDCTCPSSASCGDGVVNQAGEVCDGADDTACPGACLPDCTCPASPPPAVPTASTWGLVAMTLLLLGGARVLFGRRSRHNAVKR